MSVSQRTSLIFTLLVCATVPLWSGCRSTPMTGRKQLLLIPESQEIQMGVTAYSDMLKEEKITRNQRYEEMVNRVGQRIAAVAGRSDYKWEFKVIESPTQNAFCLPGGKVAVYEGILPICQSEAGLAVVMSHEIAHALARHGGERMTHSTMTEGVKKAVGYAVKGADAKNAELVLTAYGAASKYGVILPYSRKHESEADHIGAKLMAKAGYDPSEAPLFWERFAGAKEGAAPAEFLSTHPSDARRAADLRELLPEAMQIYNQAPTKYGLGEKI